MNLPPPKIAFIVARASNGVIGKDGKLPWHIPADLQFFKRTTLGKPVVMGRKTYESIGRPLPRRTNIVVTSSRSWTAEGVVTAPNIPTALALAYEDAHRTGAAEVMVIGGSTLFDALLPQVHRIYLTEIHSAYDGDVTFAFQPAPPWREAAREDHAADGDQPAFSFVTWERPW